MALFGFKKEKKSTDIKDADKSISSTVAHAPTTQSGAASKTVSTKKLSSTRMDVSFVLRRPRITEKATEQAEHGVYVFEVATTATKKTIADAIVHFYKVTPRKIRVTQIPQKRISSKVRGRYGVKKAGKKAYVYLKKGDRIEIV